MKIQQELNNQITISLHKEEALNLLSLLEFCSHHKFEDAVSEEEINLASAISKELDSYASFEDEVEIDYINSSYNYVPEAPSTISNETINK